MPYTCVAPEIQSKFLEYQKEYTDAEKTLKAHETEVDEGIIVPALNEFRYAGQHIARALAAKDMSVAIENLDQAIRHARRAKYDAHDAVIQYYLEQCKFFKEDYKFIQITSVVAAYNDDCVALASIQDEMAQEDRNKREEYIACKIQQCEVAKRIYRRWDFARDELNKVMAVETRERKRWFFIAGATVFGIIIAMITLVITIFK